MFDVSRGEKDQVLLSGRLDASQVEKLKGVLDTVTQSCILDFAELEYISSAGLGVLLRVQKRLKGTGDELTLTGMNHHIRDIFRFAGLDQVFKIET